MLKNETIIIIVSFVNITKISLQIVSALDQYKETHKKKNRTRKALKVIKKIDTICHVHSYGKKARQIHKNLENMKAGAKKEEEKSVFSDADFERISKFNIKHSNQMV